MPSNPAISSPPRERAHRRRLPRGTARAVLLVAVGISAVAALADTWFGFGGTLVWRSLALAMGGALLVSLLAGGSSAPEFGMANTVTLVRGGLTLWLLALLGLPTSPALDWLIVAVAVLAVTLDGVDGRLARRRNEANAFGARFDMETDALTILVLAALVWQHGKAGPWILLAGLLRYVFVVGSYAWPALDHELPPSRRRQTVCVLQIVSLIAALAPFVTPPASTATALAGLALLVWSFAVDVAWLARRTTA